MSGVPPDKPARRGTVLLVAALIGTGTTVLGGGVAHAADNIAVGKPTTASSVENGGTAAANATDGDPTTRWSSGFSDPQWIRVDLGQPYALDRVTLTWETAYGRAYEIQLSPDGTTWYTVASTGAGDGGVDDLAVTGTGRYLRVFGTQRATRYGYSLFEIEVTGVPAGGRATLLSQGRPVTASSTENGSTVAANAVDGDAGTRWSSAFSDPQWIRVDLGAPRAVLRVAVQWETAYGRAYQIQTSPNGTTWTTVFATTTGDGGFDDAPVNAITRYVRLYGTQRATQYGYSVFELQIYGS